MKSLRNWCTGRWPVHSYPGNGLAAALLIGAASMLAPTPAAAQSAAAAPVRSAPAMAPSPLGQSIADFYKARKGAPLWLSPEAGDSAQQLVSLLSTASLDGLSPDKYHPAELEAQLQAARTRQKRKDIERADEALSEAFVAYIDDLRRDPGVGITYVDPQLRPAPPSPLAALLQAAAAPSLSEYVSSLGWMHPLYGQLRHALADHQYSDDEKRQVLELNLQRARALPAGKQRYVLVNAAQQRLYMYDDGKPVDSMVVVVGKPKWPTPMLTAYIRYAALNPYWYVPPDLVPEDVAQYVVKYGLKYLDDYGYEIVSDWTPNPTIIDPKTLDWKAVNDGKVEINIRQKPGPKNFMGRMKFMFPNQFGVYLHDNPRRELFKQSTRYFSGGCVRLEDAARLGRWLFGRDLDWQSAGTEQPVPLAQPVPVYITYLTAMPDGQSIAYYDDAYGRDKAQVAQGADKNAASSNSVASR
ncbi:MAG TPA: L,D-transpeptidase family protein [Sphingomicrobium sp.]|nr:L,D-transpeptidase family protein [Sphingomicrobium sp.]